MSGIRDGKRNDVARPMSEQMRNLIIEFLVEQEQPATPELAQEITEQWQELPDNELLKANNYNRVRRDLQEQPV